MIAARYTQGGKFNVTDIGVPGIGDDDFLLRVEASSICGTDTKILKHGHRKLRDGQTITLGHEFVGTIEKLGSRLGDHAVGQRVGVAPNLGCGSCEMCGRGLMNMCPGYSAFGITFDGAHAEFVRIPATAVSQGCVIPVSSTAPATELTLAEPLSCAVNGIRASRLEMGDIVLVYGAGPMGLLNMMLAGLNGASRVVAVDPNDQRLAKAAALGATDTVNPTREPLGEWVRHHTNGRGIDVAIVAAPVRELQQEALSLLAPFGRLCLFAGLPRGEPPVALDTNAIHYKNLVVTGMTGGSPRDYRDALKLIETRRVDVRRIISDVFPMQQMSAAYERAVSGQGMKIVVESN
jgi:L-iditol 2-dehydrogenase